MTDWTPPNPLSDEGDLSYLLELVHRRPAWHALAACLGVHSDGGPNIFFSDSRQDQIEARRICSTCPALRPCRKAGAAETHGTWAGESERARKRRRVA